MTDPSASPSASSGGASGDALAVALRSAFGSEFYDLRTTLARHKTACYGTRRLAEIVNITLHHSVMPVTGTWERAALYHVRAHEWPGIGYGLGVYADGQVCLLNDPTVVSYHAGGVWNRRSLGLCVMGNYEARPASEELWGRVIATSGVVCEWLGRDVSLIGHREVAATACPGKYLYARLKAGVRDVASEWMVDSDA
jgi:hypothetical protein